MSTVFHFDLNACTGCAACRLACTIENELPWGTSWRQVSTYNAAHRVEAPSFHLSHACYHCEDAPCRAACPARAISREEATGVVLIDGTKCVGCGYCGWVCPFDAPVYDEAAGVMTKCTFCHGRLAEGLAPACVSQCPTGALWSTPARDPGGRPHVEGFPPHEVGPAARFVPLRAGAAGPITHLGQEDPPRSASPASGPSISLRDEWPLVVFTLVAAALVAWWFAALLGGPPVRPFWFLGAGVVAMGLGAVHLGQPLRAWRVVLGLGSSWLSREVVAFHAFLGLAAVHLFLPAAGGEVVAWTVAVLGLVAAFCVDRVYDPLLPRRPLPLQSADAVPTAVLGAILLAGIVTLAVPMLVIVGALYARRGGGPVFASGGREVAWASTRLGLGIVGTLVLLLAGQHEPALACFALGAVLDRIEFYLALTPWNPARQMAQDLEARLARTRASDPAA